MSLEEKVALKLIDKNKTLCVAESCSGGLLSHRLTNIPGSSRFLKCTVIAYSNDAKEKILKIPQDLMKKYGAVSEEVAVKMAQNIRKLFQTDFGISITGIAGPTGATKSKPIGLVFVALSTPEETLCLKCQFKGTRESIKSQSTTQALELLLEFL